MNAQDTIEKLFEATAPTAPPPTKRPVTKPAPGRKFSPFRRRDIKPGTAPRPKADFASYMDEAKKKKAAGLVAQPPGKVKRTKESLADAILQRAELDEAKKKKAKGQVATSPGKVNYGKRHESLARRLLDS